MKTISGKKMSALIAKKGWTLARIFVVGSIAALRTSRKSIAKSWINGGCMTPANGRQFF
jgi:hypothetical protein